MRFSGSLTARRCAALLLLCTTAAHAREYDFDRTISRKVLENYLSRATTMMDLATGRGDLDDNIRMLSNIGCKFAGRAVYLWGGESQLPRNLSTAKRSIEKLHAVDSELMIQGCVFEIVSKDVETIAIPDWVFQTFDLAPEQRTFRYESMRYPSGRGHNHWGRDASIPDISQLETQMWFYFLSVSYIDVGCEAIHFGQAEIMDGNDPDHKHWWELLQRVRKYAQQHARRHYVICDAHVPSGGVRYQDHLLFDFHSFPLRIVEVLSQPQGGILEVGATDSIYGRSMGGIAPSGWKCDHLPYLVEVDNWGSSDKPGQPGLGGCWIWGYDEMSWFAHQDEAYRNRWLRYAWQWVRDNDSNGFLQMPGSRVLHSPVDGQSWYFANTRSDAVPQGFNQEETIKSIWSSE